MRQVYTLYKLQPTPRGPHTKRKNKMQQIVPNQIGRKKGEKGQRRKNMAVRERIRKGTRKRIRRLASRQGEGRRCQTEKMKL